MKVSIFFSSTLRARAPKLAAALCLMLAAALASVCARSPVALARQQPSQSEQKSLSKKDRDRGLDMLKTVKDDLKEFYYDPNIRGMDLDARFKVAEDRVRQANSNGEIFSIIAGLLVELNDSHTYFIPPVRMTKVDYGWRMQMIGDKCYVVDVVAGSDAERKGMKAGDEVWSIDGFEPTRENLWKIKYSYYVLRPRQGMRVVLQDPEGRQRELAVMAKFDPQTPVLFWEKKKKKDEEAEPPPFYEPGGGVIIWKMASFAVPEKEVDEALKRVRPFKSLVLDLRGNGGGYEKTLLRMLGYFFDRDVKLGDIRRRRGTRQLVAKSQGGRAFAGRLVVLVDSNSASAAELFARTIQLEKRGTILGDRSSGKVMRSMLHGEAAERGTFDYFTFVPFAVSVTDADITMSDGKGLEGEGVAPDELVLPTHDDLARGLDPVLSRAAALAGTSLDPRQAGALFPRLRKSAVGESESDEDKDDKDSKDDKNGKDSKDDKDKKKG